MAKTAARARTRSKKQSSAANAVELNAATVAQIPYQLLFESSKTGDHHIIDIRVAIIGNVW